MDDRHPALENFGPLELFIDQFAKELVQERIDNGHIDVRNMSFAEMEMLSHQMGQRVAQQLGHEMTERQSELYWDDYGCPTCGLECEAIRHTRTTHSIDGETEAAEAHRSGFFLADRKAFVADGMKCNWTIWKTLPMARLHSDRRLPPCAQRSYLITGGVQRIRGAGLGCVLVRVGLAW